MLEWFDPYRGISAQALVLRMVLSLCCGSLIGIEREFKRRPAGFRTHILICLGAMLTTLTGEYLLLERLYPSDPARLGAQVIAGIGFIGAGTIIVTKNQQVKGLTTAAGLWAVAIAGLAIGTGFYEGAILTTLLIFCAELVFGRMELWITRPSPEVNVLFAYSGREGIDRLIQLLRQEKVKLLHLEITRANRGEEGHDYALCALRLHKKCSMERLAKLALAVEGITDFQEL